MAIEARCSPGGSRVGYVSGVKQGAGIFRVRRQPWGQLASAVFQSAAAMATSAASTSSRAVAARSLNRPLHVLRQIRRRLLRKSGRGPETDARSRMKKEKRCTRYLNS